MSEQIEHLAKLRAPFEPGEIHKLPKGIDKSKGPKASCNICGGWHEPAAVHLDYAGHAAVTGRLLDVDPGWTWEPVAYDEQGLPALIRNEKQMPVGLWIKLTVCGVTRIGYGSCEAGKAEAVKELIGDALRNAAMRFGVALDLWKKDDASKSGARSAQTQRQQQADQAVQRHRPQTQDPPQQATSAAATPPAAPAPAPESKPATNGHGHEAFWAAFAEASGFKAPILLRRVREMPHGDKVTDLSKLHPESELGKALRASVDKAGEAWTPEGATK